MPSVRRLAVVLGAFLLVADVACAQRSRDRPFAEQGDIALIATVRGLDVLRLDPVDGGVGARYRLADRTVLGVSLGLSLSDRHGENEHEEDRGGSGSGETEGNGSNARLNVWLEQHVGRRRGPISPFVGAGVTLGRGRNEVALESVRVNTCPEGVECPAQVLTQRSEDDHVSVGGALLVGAEVKLVRGVTLGAAYRLGAQYVSYDRFQERTIRVEGQRDRVERFDSDETVVSLQTRLTDLMLSIYL